MKMRTFSRIYHVDVLVETGNKLLAAQPPLDRLQRHLREWLTNQYHGSIFTERAVRSDQLSDKLITDGVLEVFIDGNCVLLDENDMDYSLRQSEEGRCVVDPDTQLHVHVYCLEEGGPEIEEVDDEAGLPAANQWLLPSRDFHGLWPNLVYDGDIKKRLLNYVGTTLLFSDRAVDSNVISWNRVVLLHGPPGTGKTSLCKALAQKLAIRLRQRYAYTHLVEINSHSLFSKWFSESGKLVHKMFAKILELVEDSRALVVVLIDEVESLTAARRNASGAEPSDAIRVVNALLTQIDQIRRFPNVLIVTTTNITGAIDLAFVDRADIKQLVPLPTVSAVYRILQSCVEELSRVGVLSASVDKLFSLYTLQLTSFTENTATDASLRLWSVAKLAAGALSGRTLRKLPFLAVSTLLSGQLDWHAAGNRQNGADMTDSGCGVGGSVSLDAFLSALRACVEKEFTERQQMIDSECNGAHKIEIRS